MVRIIGLWDLFVYAIEYCRLGLREFAKFETEMDYWCFV